MSQAKSGDKVRVHYAGKFDDGTVFDSSREREQPLEFTLGQGRLIKGFENAVTGMAVGETKTVGIPPDEAYGLRNEDLMRKMERATFPAKIKPEVEMGLVPRLQGDSLRPQRKNPVRRPRLLCRRLALAKLQGDF
jgi:FKBP-type peptidyl-prolyl cis-trans isomerase 2